MLESALGFTVWASGQAYAFLSQQGAEFFISILAIVLAVWSGRQSSRHAGLSVLPAFSVWVEYPREQNRECLIKLANKGFGPAIIDETLVFYNGCRVEGFQFTAIEGAIRSAFSDDIEDVHEAAEAGVGHAIGVNEEVTLVGFTIKNEVTDSNVEDFGARLQTLSFRLKYRDIYQRSWQFYVHNSIGRTLRVNSPRFILALITKWRFPRW